MPNRPPDAGLAAIHLGADEAIILFEYLSEWLSDNRPAARTAEIAVLEHVLGQLEKQLVAPFADDYGDVLAAARARLKPAD